MRWNGITPISLIFALIISLGSGGLLATAYAVDEQSWESESGGDSVSVATYGKIRTGRVPASGAAPRSGVQVKGSASKRKSHSGATVVKALSRITTTIWRPAGDATWGCRGQFNSRGAARGCLASALVCTTSGAPAKQNRKFVLGTEVNNKTGNRTGKTSTGACVRPGKKAAPGATESGSAEPAPVEVTLTAADLKKLDIKPLTAFLGPTGDWIPVNADVIVYAERNVQTLNTTMLDQQVQVRATPVRYEWSSGDGTVLTTHFAGQAYPKRDITMRYEYEGWYQLSLTTYFAGEYSVNGGEFQPIDGEVGVVSEKKWLYADSRESRLVNGPVDKQYTEIPARTKDTLGPQNPDAEHKRLRKPGINNRD